MRAQQLDRLLALARVPPLRTALSVASLVPSIRHGRVRAGRPRMPDQHRLRGAGDHLCHCLIAARIARIGIDKRHVMVAVDQRPAQAQQPIGWQQLAGDAAADCGMWRAQKCYSHKASFLYRLWISLGCAEFREHSMSFTVAIDGPAAAGKGTISRAVAAHFGFAYLDTGLLYRATGRRTLDGTDAVQAARALDADDLKADDLRRPEVAQAASRVAAISEVRQALLDFQRAFAARDGGAVLDGRDIGTVICPDAQVKLFVTASDAVRARRRHAELLDKGHEVTLDGVLDDLRQRDARDSARATAPLKPAPDAVLLDTTNMSIDTAVAEAIHLIDAALSR